MLQEELGIDYDPAEALITTLIENNPANPADGDKPFYSDDNNYHRCYQSSEKYLETWDYFSDRIKHQRRFFDEEARTLLAKILGEPGSIKANQLPVFELGPNTRAQFIFRARRVDSEQIAKTIKTNPARELGPPPIAISAGRMNPVGISVFYGALSKDTAIAEVRPFVGGLVVVGQFKPTRKLKLLDLSQKCSFI